MPFQPPNLLVLSTTYMGNSREIMEGLIAYSNEREPIDFLFELSTENMNLGLLQQFPQAQGYVLAIYNQELIETLIATGRPVVMTYQYPDPRVAQVICDELAIGRLAFAHFHGLGLKHFAALQMPWTGAEFAHQRVAGYQEAAKKAGFPVHLSPADPPIFDTQLDQPRLIAWLKSLPKPIGLFCMVVVQAAGVMLACRKAELRIPEEVAVLGVDRDDLACNLVTPKLSAIDTGAFRIGYEAAGLALRMLRGAPRPRKPLIIPPGEVIMRQSTNVLAIDDPGVAAAVRFIRENACKGIQVRDILPHVPMSRRKLEMGFQRYLACTVHEEINRVRMLEAQRLLTGTNLAILEVSLRSGFGSLSDFSKVFRRQTRLTPRNYRQLHRGSPSR